MLSWLPVLTVPALALTLAPVAPGVERPAPWIAAAAAAADSVRIQEWLVPWEKTRPRDPSVDAQSRVWFVGQVGNYVAYMNPATGEFKRYELEARTLPHNLIVGRDGAVWYAGNANGRIGKLDPLSGEITTYMMPDSAVRDPHTLVFDQRGEIWFTAQNAGYVGKLTTSTGDIQLVEIGRGTRPYGIVVDAQNRPWFNQSGTNKIGTIDPASMTLREFELPEDARSRRIAATPDGMIWYVDHGRGALGRLDPRDGTTREFAAPSGQRSRPYAMTQDDRGRLWFVETGVQPNMLVGFDPAAGEYLSSTAVPSGGGAVRHMIFHEPTRSLWFGTDTGFLARADVP